MGNRWHATQVKNMQPDVKALPCPFCGFEHGLVVDTEKHEGEHLNTWTGQASCHECGASAPHENSVAWSGHPLYETWLWLNWDNEREVVNLAVKIWNGRT